MNNCLLPVGTTLRDGTYIVEKHLSSGGFGNTYLVRNLNFDELFAMKEFFMKDINLRKGNDVTVSVPGNKATFDSQRLKFKKEAQRLRKLNNEHIVKVHDLFEENDTVYYVMDYIEGASLSEKIKEGREALNEKNALNIFRQMLDALSFIHNQNPVMLHLDIKPSNIMVDKRGNAYLLDFGSSKLIDSDDGITTSSGFTLTKGYAPAELIDGNKDRIGPWTDLYELGATLYFMISGERPPSVSEISENGKNAFTFPAHVSNKSRDLVYWLMDNKRNLRPKSVNEILSKLNYNENDRNENDDDPTELGDNEKKPTDNPSKPSKKEDSILDIDIYSNKTFKKALIITCCIVGIAIIIRIILIATTPNSWEIAANEDKNRYYELVNNCMFITGEISDNADTLSLYKAKDYYDNIVALESKHASTLPNVYNESAAISEKLDPLLKEASKYWGNLAVKERQKGNDLQSLDFYQTSISLWKDNELYNSFKDLVSSVGYMRIRSCEFANVDDSLNIIDDYGSTLYASRIKYLRPQIYYDGFEEVYDSMAFYVKFIDADGNLITGKSSPRGYSTSEVIFRVNEGRGNSLRFGGWGNANGGSYTPGTNKFEIWYNKKKIYSTKFQIH